MIELQRGAKFSAIVSAVARVEFRLGPRTRWAVSQRAVDLVVEFDTLPRWAWLRRRRKRREMSEVVTSARYHGIESEVCRLFGDRLRRVGADEPAA